MANLTNSERDHIYSALRDREAAMIQAATAADPEWESRITERTRKIAIGKLKIDKEATELAKIDAQMSDLTERREEVDATISRKMPFGSSGRNRNGSCATRLDMCSAIAQIVDQIRPVETAKDPIGKKVFAAREDYRIRCERLAKSFTHEAVELNKVLD